MEDIQVGTIFEQVAVIEDYGFDYVGQKFEVTEIIKNNVFKCRGIDVGVGFCATREEVELYFEVVNEEVIEEPIEAEVKQDAPVTKVHSISDTINEAFKNALKRIQTKLK